jgi:hypothetical protein
MKEERLGCSPGAAIGVVIVILFMSIIMSSCKTAYVPIESVRTEYRDRFLHDSIYVKDSIYIRERGDTVLVDRYNTKYVERLRVDSFCKIDTLQVPYPVEVIKRVEKELSWWQNIKMDVGGIAIGALLLIAVYYGVKLFKAAKTGDWLALIKGIIGK